MSTRCGPLLAWLAIQIAALCLGAARVPLSARTGTGPQHLAFAEMVIVQLTVATTLFPVLMREGVGIFVAITSLPFLQLAALLTATPMESLAGISVGILLWICGLRAWSSAIRSRQNRLIVIAVLNCFVIGGPILSYLIREFSDSPEQTAWTLPAVCNPLASMLKQTPNTSFSAFSLSAPLALLGSGGLAMVVRKSKFSRARLSTSFPKGAL